MVSTTLGSPTATHPDATALIELPRRQYIEIRIILLFLVAVGDIETTGNAVFKLMRQDPLYRFAYMLRGGSSFSEMSNSLLAIYESSRTTVTSSQKSAERIVNPKVNVNTTPNTKKELFLSVGDNGNAKVIRPLAATINNLPLPAREAKRLAQRGMNPEIAIDNVAETSDGVIGKALGLADIQQYITDANKAKEDLLMIVSPLFRIAKRLYGKYRGFAQAKNNAVGEFKGVRGRCLAEWIRKCALMGLYYKPAILLFRDGLNVDLGNLLSKKNLQLGGIHDLLVYVICKEEESVADLRSLDEVFFIARANSGSGSFGGSSLMDLAILNQLLSIDVSWVILTT